MRKNTKERISQESLRLFSIYGYQRVSTKAIAEAVGIKDSSLYNHFKGKKAIFDKLQVQYQSTAEKMMHQLETACSNDNRVDTNSFQIVNDIFFEKYLMNDFCNRFIRIMLIEQYNNSEIQLLYTKWMLDMPLQFQSKLFGIIGSQWQLNTDDYGYLALKFYAPIYLYTHKYLLVGELTDEKKDFFRRSVNKHIQLFMQEMGGIKDGNRVAVLDLETDNIEKLKND